MALTYITADGREFTAADGTLLVLAAGDLLGLITDRTQADVDRWRELHDKGWTNMSSAEQTEWLAEMKGRYSYTDMNRVENAVATLSGTLKRLGYIHPNLTIKTDWTRSDRPTREDMDRYFGNVDMLRKSIPVFPSTPTTPTTGKRLDYARANDLEKILEDIDNVSSMIPKSWLHAGDVFVGEV